MTSASLNAEKLRGALFAAMMGDSLAMPVHWYYDLNQLQRHFGTVTDYQTSHYPLATIMQKSATGTGGRGPDTGEIIGKVINHGKRKYWARNAQYHYHHGLKAGENTLDAHVMLVLLRSITTKRGVDLDDVSQSYIDFMTTPGSHNDVYASTAHRMFFRNLKILNKAPKDCPDNDHHNVDAIDGLINVVPVVLMGLAQGLSEDAIVVQATQVMYRYRNAPNMVGYIKQFVHLCVAAYNSKDAKDLSSRLNVNFESVSRRRDPMSACYISSSFPALVHFVAKYGDGPIHEALLANANAGGENVARGICLGTVLGLLHGYNSIPQRWITKLVENEKIGNDFNAFIQAFSQKPDL